MMRRPITRARPAPVFSIGILSDRTGVNVETIRYYERIGLLPAPPRSAGRHRLYEAPHRQRLVFIRRARELGFSLDQVRALLGLARGHKLACDDVKVLTEVHIAEIRGKIRDLKKLDRVLCDLAARCRAGRVPECPILDVLSAGS